MFCVDLCRFVDRGFLTGFTRLTGLMEVFVTIKALFALNIKACKAVFLSFTLQPFTLKLLI